MLALVLFLFVGALFLRILPCLLAKGDASVDHWYWKAYIETYRRDRHFPPILPQYLLDEHQWYPPLFPRLMAILPEAFFSRFHFWFSISVDLLRMALLLAATVWLSGGELVAVFAAGAVYATTPILISYNTQLNPRGIGALLLDGLVLLSMWLVLYNGPTWGWIIALVLAGAILLTHKMTTQLFWFLCLCGGVLLLEWRLLVLIPASIVMAMLLSRGFYWKVLLAHWDIVTFWHRNWLWLQAHPLKESPLYGEPGYETPTKFHRRGWSGVIRHLSYLGGFSPAIWALASLLIVGASLVNDKPTFSWITGWMQATILFSLLTVFVPFIKCLGSGYYYLYNAVFPTALIAGLLLVYRDGADVGPLIIIAAIGGNLTSLIFYYRSIRARVHRSDEEFEHMIEYLKAMPKGTVMCLPPQWYDLIAYKTGQPVLWGAHGYGFKQVEPLFPRLLLPIHDIIRQYGVRYLITKDGYLPATFLTALPYESVVKFGDYRVFLAKSCSP